MLLSYEVVLDDGEGTPVHSLVHQHILVSPPVTRDDLEETLRAIHAERRLGPFVRRPHAPDVYLYVFDDVAKLRAREGGWVAFLASSKGGEPELLFNDRLIALSGKPPEARFGLSEQMRRALVLEVTACEDKGKGSDECEPRVAAKHGLALADLKAILMEGVEKHWPLHRR